MKSIKIAAAAVCAIGILALTGCNAAKNSTTTTTTATATSTPTIVTETGATTYKGEIFASQ
ncbi:MAG: hypothetical protein LBL87_03675 [Ruminococcus sp.]|jgi:uncharacterized lipoprotein YajG|nr:hypothetical protein [Ruminococcus sp.]